MKKLTGSFRYTHWDPWLIISQIVALQSILYLSLGIIISILSTITGDTRSLNLIFDYHEIQVRDFGGRMVISAYVINSLVGSAGLWWIVERTKLCLDFSCTWHFIHLIFCWIYNGNFPTFSWWVLNVACATLMCVCGEFLCLKTELKAIPLSLGPKTDL